MPLDRGHTTPAGDHPMDVSVGNGAVMPAGAQGQRSPTESFLLADPWHAGTSLSEGSGGHLPIVGDAETQCIGEAFARDLGDEELEQTIEYLIARRDRTDLAPTDREVAIENLAVLAAESARRGRSSAALDRDAVRTLICDAIAGSAAVLLGEHGGVGRRARDRRAQLVAA